MYGMDVTAFARHLAQLSSYLPYFPMRLVNGKPVKPEPITEEHLVEAIPERWEQMILRTGRAPEDFASIHEAVTYYVKFQQADDRSGHGKPPSNNPNVNDRKRKHTQPEKDGKGKTITGTARMWCKHCKKPTHNSKDCWSKVSCKRPKKDKKVNGKGGKEFSNVTFSKDQFQTLVKGFQAQKNNGGNEDAFIAKIFGGNDFDCKCKITSRAITAMYSHCQYCTAHTYQCYAIQESAMLKQNMDNTDSDRKRKSISDEEFIATRTLKPSVKRPKFSHFTAEVVVEIENKEGNTVPIRALLDTGTSSTIILNEHMRKGFVSHHKGHVTTWKTLGGNQQTVTWVAHVDDENMAEDSIYDMIIGMDLMTTIGIYVDTAQKMVMWGDSSVMEAMYHLAKEPELLKEAEERQSRILDADYSNVDIDEYVDSITKLDDDQKSKLRLVLNSHPTLFGGGLRELNAVLRRRPYPLPKISDLLQSYRDLHTRRPSI
jgi:hypothetical protein